MTARRLVSNATILNLKISGSILPRVKPFFAFHLFSVVFSRKQSLANSITQLNRSTLTMISCVVRSAPACSLCYGLRLLRRASLALQHCRLVTTTYSIYYIATSTFSTCCASRLWTASLSFPSHSRQQHDQTTHYRHITQLVDNVHL